MQVVRNKLMPMFIKRRNKVKTKDVEWPPALSKKMFVSICRAYLAVVSKTRWYKLLKFEPGAA